MATASVSDDDGGDGDDDEARDAQGATHGTVGDTERDGEGEEDVEDDVRWLGHASPLGCGWCEFQGEWQRGATRFLGYSKKHKFALATINDRSGEEHFAWDEALTLTDQQHCERASMAALNKRRPKSEQVPQRCIGCHGFSIFRLMLPYVDYPTFLCCPCGMPCCMAW